MRKIALALTLLSTLLFGISITVAQEGGSGVEITFPLPVNEVWGQGDVTGTASIVGMAYYYLQDFRSGIS